MCDNVRRLCGCRINNSQYLCSSITHIPGPEVRLSKTHIPRPPSVKYTYPRTTVCQKPRSQDHRLSKTNIPGPPSIKNKYPRTTVSQKHISQDHRLSKIQVPRSSSVKNTYSSTTVCQIHTSQDLNQAKKSMHSCFQ